MDIWRLLTPLLVPAVGGLAIWLLSLEWRFAALKRALGSGAVGTRGEPSNLLRAAQREVERKRRAAREMVPTAVPVRVTTAPPMPVSASLDLQVDPEPVSAPMATRAASRPAVPPPPRPVTTPAIDERVEPARAASPAMSLEAFLGGRVLLFAGVIAVLFGIAFFLKMAIERGYFPPEMRLLGGALAGVLALVGGDRLRSRGYDVFGHALMGCGQGALYLCIYFAALRYDLISNGAAFLLSGLLTALGVTLAWFRRAPALAYLGFLGGFLAPAFFGQATDSLLPLAVWLLLLDVGIGVVTIRRRWSGLDLMALGASVLYLLVAAGGRGGTYAPLHVATVVACLVAGKLVMALLPALTTGRPTSATGLVTSLGAGLWGATLGIAVLHDAHATTLGLGILGLGAVYGLLAVALPARRDGSPSPETPLFASCALAALVGAVPILFDGVALAAIWAAFGTAAVFIGCRRRLALLQAGGAFVGLLAALMLVPAPYHTQAFVPFLSGISLSYALPLVALAASGWILRTGTGAASNPSGKRTGLGSLLLVAAAWLGVPYVMSEVATALELSGRVVDGAGRHARIALVAASLAVYAGGLLAATWRMPRRALVLPAGPLLVALATFALMLGARHGGPVTPLVGTSGLCGLIVMGALGVFVARLPAAARRAGVYCVALGAFALLTSELYWWGEGRVALDPAARAAARRAAQSAISIVWALSGALSLALGFVRARTAALLARDLRWIGLALLFVTVGKVFLLDLARLDTVSKVGSFLVLGVLMVAGSFLYQKARRATVALED